MQTAPGPAASPLPMSRKEPRQTSVPGSRLRPLFPASPAAAAHAPNSVRPRVRGLQLLPPRHARRAPPEADAAPACRYHSWAPAEPLGLTHCFAHPAQRARNHVHQDRAGADMDITGERHARDEAKVLRKVAQIELVERDPRLVIGVVRRAAVVVDREGAFADPAQRPIDRTVLYEIERIQLDRDRIT